MNALWPILVIIFAALGWFAIDRLVTEPDARKGFQVALIIVVAILLVLWLFGVFGGGLYVPGTLRG